MPGPSLLTPDRPAAPWRRLDLLAAAVAFLVAVVARAALAGSHPYTAEAAHYLVARELWGVHNSVHNLYNSVSGDWAFLFWQRPLFSLALWPGAALSFEAYRFLHLGVTSLLPALALLLIRQLGASRWLAWPVGLVVALHPLFVIWGTLALPDSLMAVFTVAGLLAGQRGRPLACAAFLLAACWTKEVAIVTVLPLLLFALWRDSEGTPTRLWPLSLGRFSTALAATAGLAFLPLLFSLSKPGATFPGWGLAGPDATLVERLFPLLWLAPIPLVGLAFPAARRISLLALAWGGFFLAYNVVLGRAVEAWYAVLPATLTLVACAATLGAAWAKWPAPRRLAVPAVALALASLLALQVAVPDTSAEKVALVTPFSGRGQWSLEQATAFEAVREDRLYEQLDRIAPDEDVLAVDVDWAFLLYPIQDRVGELYAEDTLITHGWHLDLRILAHGIENRTDAVLLHVRDTPLNHAIRSTYADCVVASNPDYLLIRGAPCQGRAALLDQTAHPAAV